MLESILCRNVGKVRNPLLVEGSYAEANAGNCRPGGRNALPHLRGQLGVGVPAVIEGAATGGLEEGRGGTGGTSGIFGTCEVKIPLAEHQLNRPEMEEAKPRI